MNEYRLERRYTGKVKAVVMDWAGTMIDHGCCAPVHVFVEAFRSQGVVVTEAEAREPMGKAKWEHIHTMAQMPSVKARFIEKHGREPQNSDIDTMYERFLPLLLETVGQFAEPIPGVLETLNTLKARGIRHGSSTGYPRAAMDRVLPKVATLGLAPEVVLTSSDAKMGRPAPYLIFEAMQRLEVLQVQSVVKVDDSPFGLEAARNAGCWAVGLAASGNLMGLSVAELAALAPEERAERTSAARVRLEQSGAHFVIDSVADLIPVIDEIEARLANGVSP